MRKSKKPKSLIIGFLASLLLLFGTIDGFATANYSVICNYNSAGQLVLTICGLSPLGSPASSFGDIGNPQDGDYYEVLWFFEGGEYGFNQYLQDPNLQDPTTGSPCIKDSFCLGYVPTSFRAEITYRGKTDDDDDLDVMEQEIFTCTTAQPCMPSPNTNTKPLSLMRMRPSKINNHTTYILKLDSDSCCDNGFIEVSYDPAIVEPGGEDSWGGNVPSKLEAVDVTLHPCIGSVIAIEPGFIQLKLNTCAALNQGCWRDGKLIIPLYFTPIAQGPITISADWFCCQQNKDEATKRQKQSPSKAIDLRKTCRLSHRASVTESSSLGDDDPYDPNYKKIGFNKTSMFPHLFYALNEAQEVFFKIHFQNEGIGPASTVRIRDTLESLFDPAAFEMVYARLGNQEIDFASYAPASIAPTDTPRIPNIFPDNSTARKDKPFFYSKTQQGYPVGSPFVMYSHVVGDAIEWILYKRDGLPGLKSPDVPDIFTTEETTGEVIFKVEKECFEGDYGKILLNDAWVEFMDSDTVMPPIVTDSALLEKICCDTQIQIVNFIYSLHDFDSLKNDTQADSITLIQTDLQASNAIQIKVYNDSIWGFQYVYADPDDIPYRGLDKVLFLACNSATNQCDTIERRICINLPPGNYPCDGTPCLPPPPPPCPWIWIIICILILIAIITFLYNKWRS